MKPTPRTPHRDGLTGLRDLLAALGHWLAGLPAAFHRFLQAFRRLPGLPRRLLGAVHPWHNARRTLSVGLAIFLLVFCAGLLLKVVDPLGLDGVLQQHSERLSSQVAAPFYGAGPGGELAQDHIAVVLINDATLTEWKSGWPPDYTMYAHLLERILKQRPRAVFLDILLEHERGYDPGLAKAQRWVAEAVEEAGIPVYFATANPAHRTLFSSEQGVSTAVISWEGLGDEYPLVVPEANQVKWRGDPGGNGADARAPPGEAWSPAYALYRGLCDAQAGPGPWSCDLDSPGLPMALQWGYRVPDSPYCSPRAPQPTHPLTASLAGLWTGLRSGLEPELQDTRRTSCPYTFTLPAGLLLGPNTSPQAASVLRDRVVLVGTQVPGLNDFVLSPIHQKLPGVYLHAMALDNLMTWGDGHLRRTPGMFLLSEILAALAASLLAAVVLRAIRGPGRWFGLVAAGLLVVLAQGIVLQKIFHQPPIDWIGGLTLLVLVVFAVRDKVGRDQVDTESP